MIIFTSDVRDIRQYEGRARGSNTFIYDLVDSFKPLESHYAEREEWYRQRGAKIIVENVGTRVLTCRTTKKIIKTT